MLIFLQKFEVIVGFLRSAVQNLSSPFTLVEPSPELPMRDRYGVGLAISLTCMYMYVLLDIPVSVHLFFLFDRKRILAKQLAEFIILYRRVSRSKEYACTGYYLNTSPARKQFC